MSLQQFLPTSPDDADRRTLGNDSDRTPIPNDITASTHNLPGRDSASVRLPDETKPSLTDTLVANPNYSKCPSGKSPILLISVNFVSILPDICRGRSNSLQDSCCR